MREAQAAATLALRASTTLDAAPALDAGAALDSFEALPDIFEEVCGIAGVPAEINMTGSTTQCKAPAAPIEGQNKLVIQPRGTSDAVSKLNSEAGIMPAVAPTGLVQPGDTEATANTIREERRIRRVQKSLTVSAALSGGPHTDVIDDDFSETDTAHANPARVVAAVADFPSAIEFTPIEMREPLVAVPNPKAKAKGRPSKTQAAQPKSSPKKRGRPRAKHLKHDGPTATESGAKVAPCHASHHQPRVAVPPLRQQLDKLTEGNIFHVEYHGGSTPGASRRLHIIAVCAHYLQSVVMDKVPNRKATRRDARNYSFDMTASV